MSSTKENKQYNVFDASQLARLVYTHSSTFDDLAKIEKNLNGRFSNMEKPIRALILAAAAGEPLLFVGPPGTAKSRLIRTFCQYIGLIKPDHQQSSRGVDRTVKSHADYFEYLLTPFTEPGELFGYFDMAKASQEGRLVRTTTNMMQEAKVVYLDEVFNGSSAILNSILSFLQERTFHDRGTRTKVKMEILFGATNQTPDTPELRAVFDRFLLRCYVDNVVADPEEMQDLLMRGWTETYARPDLQRVYPNMLTNLESLRDAIQIQAKGGGLAVKSDNDDFFKRLAREVKTVRYTGQSDMSNRRLVKMLFVMTINAMYRAAQVHPLPKAVYLSDQDIDLLKDFALDEFDDEKSLLLDNGRFGG